MRPRERKSVIKLLPCIIVASLCIGMISGCANEAQDNSGTSAAMVEERDISGESSIQNKMTMAQEVPGEKEADYSRAFEGLAGCAVTYEIQDNTYSFYNKTLCETEVSPFSTFKIISTLMGLNSDVIEDETSTKKYNGTVYPVADWNGELALTEAFQTSCIWYFRQVIDEVGQEEVRRELQDLEYGNCDITVWEGSSINPQKELNGFWLDSSLKISPKEQVQVLAKIFEGGSVYSEADIKILKNIMFIDEVDKVSYYGKTGSGVDGQAWFVGFMEQDGLRKYVALYLDDAQQKKLVSGDMAEDIAIEILSPESGAEH